MTRIAGFNQIHFKKSNTNKKNIKNIATGVTTTTAAQIGMQFFQFPVNLLISDKISKISTTLSKDEIKTTNAAIDEIVEKTTNLGQKGLKIIDFSNSTKNTKTGFFDKIATLKDNLKSAKEGKNAFFVSGSQFKQNGGAILVNREKFSLPVFHELGHAYNFNNSAFWKTMQKSRTKSLALGSMFALLPLLTKEEKSKGEEKLTRKQKFKNNFRKASPALAFASMLPILSEEMTASIRGCKWAKSLLNKNLYKKVLKTNAIAYSSYLLTAAEFVLVAFAGKKVKDHFDKKSNKNNKNEAKI